MTVDHQVSVRTDSFAHGGNTCETRIEQYGIDHSTRVSIQCHVIEWCDLHRRETVRDRTARILGIRCALEDTTPVDAG
jgi:hypothetical protein